MLRFLSGSPILLANSKGLDFNLLSHLWHNRAPAPYPSLYFASKRRLAMSLRPESMEPVPEQTTRVAHSAFPKGNPYLTLRDQLGGIFQDDDFADLYPHKGQPALTPWRLALVTMMQ